MDSTADAWAVSLDAARRAAADAAARTQVALALADDLGAHTRWASPAATAFREALAAWCDELRRTSHELEHLGEGLARARVRLLAEGLG